VIPILAPPEQRWACPSCGKLAVTRETRPHAEFHHCLALGIVAPMIAFTGDELDGRQVRHVLVEREDYVGAELVRTDDNGRPWMAVDTERADGSNDRTVFAPTARISLEEARG
jgi:hypothetical protein